MPVKVRPGGIRIETPDTLRIDEQPPRTVRRPDGALPRGPIPLGPSGVAAGDTKALLRALGSQGLEIVDAVALQPTLEATPPGGQRRTAAAPIPETQTVSLDVDVSDGEHAVVLLEQDGMYSWSFPDTVTGVATARAPGRGGPTSVGAKRLRFRVDLHADQVSGPATRSGLAGHLIYDRVKAHVLKYAAALIVQEGLEYLERDSRETLLVVDGLDPTSWRSVDGAVSVPVPNDRPAKALLLVHGTFSSTVGSYGELASTPWGELFIQALKSNYDVILGFDHFTLKRDPAQNAETLVAALEKIAWPAGSQIDVVAFSRGGLVIRCLVDQLSPKLRQVLRFKRAIFVACTNEGTRLADPKRIRAFIDLYTNLSTAACRLIGMLPQAKAVTTILNELIKGVASLVKYIAATALKEGEVPGLAAMWPDGAFLRQLDQPRKRKSAFADILNYVITSEFVPRLTGSDVEPNELPARFLAAIAEGFVQQLMNEGNDLVVNTSSMGAIPPQPEQLVHDRFDFGQTVKVYHTIYFLRPEVVNAITRWLELVQPEGATTTRRRRVRGSRPIDKVLPAGDVLHDLPGVQAIPAQVDTRFTIARADAPVREVIDVLGHSPSPFVVVERFREGRTFHYAFPTDNLLQVVKGAAPNKALEKALGLHEYEASVERGLTTTGPAAERPAVVLADRHVVGVVPSVAGSSTDIVGLAKAALSSADATTAAAARRAMPTFTSKHAQSTTSVHVRAEMDDLVEVGRPASIDVTVAREVIGGYISAGARESAATVQLAQMLSLQAIVRSQFKIIGEDRYDFDVPAPNQPWTGSFDVKPTNTGDGEIWIVLTQDHATLSTVVLNPKIVESPGRRGRMVARANAAERVTGAGIDQLLIIEQRNGNEITLFFQFTSPTLGIFDKYTSQPFRSEPGRYVKDLYQRIEERWVASNEDVDDFTVELKSLGADLFVELFPERLQSKLWELRDKLRKIMIVSTEPFIPWELVHLKEPGQPLGSQLRFLAQMGVVRWLHQAGWPPTNLRVRPGRVRHVIPDYPDPRYVLHEAAAEREFMETELLSAAISPRPAALRAVLQDPQVFDLLHFACHGSAEVDNIADAKIMLEGRVEGSSYVPEYLNALTVEYTANLRNPDGNRPLVFVNACQVGRAGYKLTGLGGFAQAFLGAGAGIFAGTLWSVGDEPASTFAKTFYQRMKGGAELSDAVVQAREEARTAGDSSWLCYAVYGHPSAVALIMREA
jgi:hypothetical protein